MLLIGWSIFPSQHDLPEVLPRSGHSLSQSLLEAWARGPGGSGDTRFKIIGFRTSGHFRFKSKLEDSLLKALNHLNLQSLTLLQEQVNAIRNVVENQKWPEVLKSRTSKSCPQSLLVLVLRPPGGSGDGNEREWEGSYTFNLVPRFCLLPVSLAP